MHLIMGAIWHDLILIERKQNETNFGFKTLNSKPNHIRVEIKLIRVDFVRFWVLVYTGLYV